MNHLPNYVPYEDDDDFLTLDGDNNSPTYLDALERDYRDVSERSKNGNQQRLIDLEEDIGKKGYTKMYHFLIEGLLTQHLSGCEYAIVLLLLRMTVGYGEKETYFANSFIVDKTRYDKNHVSTSLKKLRDRNIIERTREAKLGMPAYYRVNDNILTWREI